MVVGRPRHKQGNPRTNLDHIMPRISFTSAGFRANSSFDLAARSLKVLPPCPDLSRRRPESSRFGPRRLRSGALVQARKADDGSVLDQRVAEVTSVGPSGKPEPHAVARVIGNDPLRQFLVPFPGGRFQTLEGSYDPHSNQWFNVYGNEDRQPGEWGHWTGRGMNWNDMCASCHNTRVRKNYDPANDTYHTTMAEPTVGCESCHGPPQAHNQWQKQFGKSGRRDPTLTKWPRDRIVDYCGFCHV